MFFQDWVSKLREEVEADHWRHEKQQSLEGFWLGVFRFGFTLSLVGPNSSNDASVGSPVRCLYLR